MSKWHERRIALIDGDIIRHRCAYACHKDGGDVTDYADMMDQMVRDWTARACTDTFLVCLSCSREDNFRRDFWPQYKAHREGADSNPLLESGAAILKELYPTNPLCINQWASMPRLEADDIMGALGSKDVVRVGCQGFTPVIVSIDKDFEQIPGLILNPHKDDYPREITREAADRFFFLQWLTGDATDGIPGIPRVGPKKAEKLLEGLQSYEEMELAVRDAYLAWGEKLAYTREQVAEHAGIMAQLVRIFRVEDMRAWRDEGRLLLRERVRDLFGVDTKSTIVGENPEVVDV